MDIQSLIRLAHQADLEGNYRVADKLTERAIREAAPFWRRRGPGSGGGPGGGFFGTGGPDFSMHQNVGGGHSGSGAGGPGGPISTGRANTGGGGAGGHGGGGGGAKNTSVGGSGDTPGVRQLRKRRDAGETLTDDELKQIENADKRNARDRERGPRQTAKGGGGGGGGGGGRGGDANTGATVDTSSGDSSAVGGTGNQTNNARYKTRDIGGDVIGMGTAGSVALATVPAAIIAGLAAYGFTIVNGKVVDQRGQVVPPQNLPPQVQQLMSGGAKANQLALRTQANQMGDAQLAQKFIEDRRGNPAFKTAQDFYNDAVNKGLTPSMVNQVTALAKAIGYTDLTPYTN
jgi:hypothetical protein